MALDRAPPDDSTPSRCRKIMDLHLEALYSVALEAEISAAVPDNVLNAIAATVCRGLKFVGFAQYGFLDPRWAQYELAKVSYVLGRPVAYRINALAKGEITLADFEAETSDAAIAALIAVAGASIPLAEPPVSSPPPPKEFDASQVDDAALAIGAGGVEGLGEVNGGMVAGIVIGAVVLFVVLFLGYVYYASGGAVVLWFEVHLSHSNPAYVFCYRPKEKRLRLLAELQEKRGKYGGMMGDGGKGGMMRVISLPTGSSTRKSADEEASRARERSEAASEAARRALSQGDSYVEDDVESGMGTGTGSPRSAVDGGGDGGGVDAGRGADRRGGTPRRGAATGCRRPT